MSESVTFEASTLPHRREESWKYTDLQRLLAQRSEYALPQARENALQELLAESLRPSRDGRLVFLDGNFIAAESDQRIHCEAVEPTSSHEAGLARLQQCSAARAWAITPPGNGNIHLLLLYSREQKPLVNQQFHWQWPADAKAQVLEEHIGGGEGLCISSFHQSLGSAAVLQWTRLPHSDPTHVLLAEQKVDIADGAQLQQTHVDWQAGISRLDSRLSLNGVESEVHYHALSGLRDRQHVDHQVLVRHASERAVSRLRARGIVDGQGRQVFNGKILVERGAQKTDSDQLLRNLLLSEKAEVDAKPELEIYADDVRCAHGSTVGRLDDAALFYLRSRGLGRQEARRLLMLSFAESILAQIPDEALREVVRHQVAQHLSLEQTSQ